MPVTTTEVRLYAKQADFVDCTARRPCFIGGRGSGKSFAGVVKDIAYLLDNPGCMGTICAPTYRMLHDTTKRTFLDLTPEAIIARHNLQDDELELDNGSIVLFRSLDRPDRLRGLNLAFIHMDEAAYASKEAARVLKATLRQPGFPHQFWPTSTPKGRNWIWEEWVKRPTPNHVLFTAHSTDNTHLPEDYISDLDYSGAFYRQEIEGSFESFEGMVYLNFEGEHITSAPTDIPVRVLAGVDWGFRDPATIIVLGQYGGTIAEPKTRWHVLEEFYASGLTTDEHIAKMLSLQDKYKIRQFHADPSRPDSILAARRKGVRIIAADNDILTGISCVSSLLGDSTTPVRLTVDESCDNLIREFNSYQYPDKTDKKNAGEKPVDLDNHALDSLRYVCKAALAGGGGLLEIMRKKLREANKDLNLPPDPLPAGYGLDGAAPGALFLPPLNPRHAALTSLG